MFEIVPMYDAQRLEPAALRLLELLAFLGTGLPETLVKALALELLPAAAAAAADEDEDEADEADEDEDEDDDDTPPYDEAAYAAGRDALSAEPLIVLEGPEKKLVILDALQNQVFATLNDYKRHRFFTGVTRAIWAEWPAALPAPSQPPLLPEPKTRAQQLLLVSRWPACEDLEHTVTRLEDLYPSSRELLSDEEALLCGKLITEGAWFQIERGYRSKIIPCLITAMHIGLATEHPDAAAFVADVRFCLGVVAMESNDFGVSRTHKDKSFAIVAGLCAGGPDADDERLALAYAERGVSRLQDARYDEAVADTQAAIRIMRRLRVPHGAPEANLAWALLAQRRLAECEALLDESLAAAAHDGEGTGLGLLLSAAAALRAAQGDAEESGACLRGAWEHLCGVVGKRDPCTARVAHKLAEHLLRRSEPEEALVLLNEALNAWGVDPLANQNEEARTLYWKSRAVAALGRAETATRLRKKSILLYNDITNESKDVDTISAQDFDALVPFWSR
ncbi:tetratricopeptide repeat domain containing protein [Cordyceps militaris CM01]|uniref:Tetratricopeptide repeat domain containing protein n=1 Tax=Cordyceps militaris (strain CM01) TaxID=983644 RepID=G3JT09_CORMM|nr:tetratricopeptide repeat domain containing protein [Cordyceps militaris CM01]EGX89005.1 tetratricopeptide repeat domain containing protein [Cordyceps militaris CM01]